MEKLREGSFGNVLRNAREASGVGLRELSDVTKIQVRYIEALESEDWTRVPPGVIGRGFLRLIAREIGADPKELVALYCAARGEEIPKLMVPKPEENWRFKREKPPVDPKLFLFGGGVLLVAALVGLLMWSPWSAKKAPPAQRGVEAVAEKPHKLEIRALADSQVVVEIQGMPLERHDLKASDAPFVIELSKPVRVDAPEGSSLAITWDGVEVKTPPGAVSLKFPDDLEAPKP